MAKSTTFERVRMAIGIVAGLIILYVVVCLGIAVVGQYRENAREDISTYGVYEKPRAKVARLASEAEATARAECSNVVVGITRIVNIHCSTYEDQVRKWKADAQVEFINRVGGIERTNLTMTFDAGIPGPDGYCHLSAFVETARK